MSSLASHLEALERQLLDLGTRSLPGEAGDLLAADFREFGKSGRAWTRTAVIAAMASETLQINYRLEDFSVKELGGDFALVTYSCYVVDTDGVEAKALRSSVWQREADGTWRMLFHQGTKSE
jgi:hypothetical protein